MAQIAATVLFVICLLSNHELRAKEKLTTILKNEFVINANIVKAWTVLGPGFADIQTWAAPATSSSADDQLTLNGSSCTVRDVAVSGIGQVKEKLLDYSSSAYTISYQVIDGNPKPVRHMVETWKLVDIGRGQTRLEVTTELKTDDFIGRVFKSALKRNIKKLIHETAEEFKHYVENEQPHPRKIKAISKRQK